jgi:hypothetical protein
MPSADHEHITRVIGDAHQDPAGWSPFNLRLHPRLWLRSPPHRRKGLAQPLTCHIAPLLHEPGGGLHPRRPVTTGRFPRKNRHQHNAMREREVLRVTQRGQAARRAANPGNHPAHARHDDRQLRRIGDRTALGGQAVACHLIYAGRGPLPAITTQSLIPEPRRADTHPVRLPTRLPGTPAHKAKPGTGRCQQTKDRNRPEPTQGQQR